MKIIRPMTVADSGFTRASTATYFNSSGVLSSAANDVPRLNFNPVSLSTPPVFLQETAATNILLQSETVNVTWSTSATSVSPNVTAAPDGNSTADKIVENSANASHTIFQFSGVATTIGSSYSVSAFLKAAERTQAAIEFFSGGVVCRVVVNLSTGAFVSQTGTGTYTITPLLNGWYRISVKAIAANASSALQIYLASAGSVTYTGDSSSGVYVWGCQMELGNMSSYIPTIAATVTRAADTLGAAGTLLASNLTEADYTAYSASTVYATGTIVMYIATNIHLIYESLSGSSAVATMTIASPCVVTKAGHGLAANTPISFTTTGALPTGLVAGTVYYVLAPTTDTFNLSATAGGAAINTSGSQSGTHTYTASLNYNQPVTNTTYWLQVGPTNKWKTFDQSITSQTSNTSFISDVLYVNGRADSVAVLNVNAASVTITQTDATDGVIYNNTYSLVQTSGITDGYSYCFEPVIRITDFAVTDLLPYGNSLVGVTLTDYGNTVLCGGIVVGLSRDISYLYNNVHVGTELGVKLGTQDYSVKTQDSFGNYTILQRAFRKTADFSIFVEGTSVDSLMNLLASYRATPVVYVGSASYNSTIIYGFYKDFSVDVTYHTKSVCTISLEGLT